MCKERPLFLAESCARCTERGARETLDDDEGRPDAGTLQCQSPRRPRNRCHSDMRGLWPYTAAILEAIREEVR